MDAAIDEWTELQYNLGLTLADMGTVTGAWPARAAEARTRLAVAETRYGLHPRERYDLIRPPAPKGALVYIHGGFWRARDKDELSWVAERFVEDGVTVAMINYPLCPEVALGDIVDSVRRATLHLWREGLTEAEKNNLVVSGHSAGGHLSAWLLTEDWTAEGLPAALFKGCAPISGVFELEPLRRTTINDALRLDEETAARLSVTGRRPIAPAPTALIVGGGETPEFQRQTRELRARWAELSPRLVVEPATHHFTVLDGFADRSSGLYRSIAGLLGL